RRVKGPDLESNIVDLGLVSEVLIKDGRVSFSITVPAARAHELEPLRQAAEKIVAETAGVNSVTAVLTAGGEPRRAAAPPPHPPAAGRASCPRVRASPRRGRVPRNRRPRRLALPPAPSPRSPASGI